jgi:hypothetical protein
MSKKKTTKEFIEMAIKVHGDKYDYSKVKYTGRSNKIVITCKKHGDFQQLAGNHLAGKNCLKCSIIKNRLTIDEFIFKAKIVHNNKYDYSSVKYEGANKKVTIICSKHDEFKQNPGAHLMGNGCPVCAGRFLNDKIFIERSSFVHNDKYSYKNVIYKNSKDKVEIICPIHGSFYQSPRTHLAGRGCQKCSNSGFSKSQWVEFCKNKGINKTIVYIVEC